jgi:hypothetical protein
MFFDLDYTRIRPIKAGVSVGHGYEPQRFGLCFRAAKRLVYLREDEGPFAASDV